MSCFLNQKFYLLPALQSCVILYRVVELVFLIR